MKRINVKWHVKHIPNALIRLFTNDSYYVCEECQHIHKRDGKEIRFDQDEEHNMSNQIWYGGVSRDCFDTQQQKVWSTLRNAIMKGL